MGLFSAAAGIAGSIGSSLIGNLWNDYSSRKAAKQQYDYQMEMWRANNEYNTPKAQMERLSEAGLNPNLVYGNGSATHTATMASAPAVNYKSKENFLANSLLAYQIENMRATKNNLEAQNQLLAAQVAEVDARTRSIKAGIPKQVAESFVAKKNADIYNSTGVNPGGPSGILSLAPYAGVVDKVSGIYQDIGSLAVDFPILGYNYFKSKLSKFWKKKK